RARALVARECSKAGDEIVQLLARITILTSQIVAGVGNVEHPLFIGNALPIEVQRIGGPVKIIGTVDDQLRHGQPIAIGPWVDHAQKTLAGGGSGIGSNPRLLYAARREL